MALLHISFLLMVFEIHGSVAVTHSLKYFYTGSSQIHHFPEFVAVGPVDDVPIIYFDSEIRKTVSRQAWMDKFSEEDPEFWNYQTQTFTSTQNTLKTILKTTKQLFNQTGGSHFIQNMVGCEWDNETGEVKGYEQFGYDGEDFLAFDLNTKSWIAPTPQAVKIKLKWDNNKGVIAQKKNFLTLVCPEWLKKYLNYGRGSLMRTILPSVSLLQKSPSSPVSCHATGFYPNRAEMIWKKGGEEIHEGVEKGEILPNNDGTFQMSIDLSSVPAEDLVKYECVFQLSGENKDLVTRLEKPKIRTNEGNSMMMIIPIIVALVVFAVIAVIGFILYKKKNAKRPPSPVENNEVQDQMLPTAW